MNRLLIGYDGSDSANAAFDLALDLGYSDNHDGCSFGRVIFRG